MSKKDLKTGTKFPYGLSIDIVKKISQLKNEPEWMESFRLSAYESFLKIDNPTWGPSLESINFNSIKYYAFAGEIKNSWDEVPKDIKQTFDDLGLPETEKRYLAGLTTQFESEAIYRNLKDRFNNLGIIFEDTDTALQKYPQYFKEFFGKLVPPTDNKYAALNSACWSGGIFIYVPKGVKLTMPVQSYFRINTERMGQFERTLIIADEDSEIHYIEGCTAPQYIESSLHAAVVEVFVKKNAKVRYTTIQNWSTNVYNLVTKRSITEENAIMEWVDCNLGSKITMKYPSIILAGEKSKGSILSIGFAQKEQIIDTGAKMIHLAPNTSSSITSKSISKDLGVANYRGLVKITKKALNSKSSVNCESLILSKNAKSYAYPIDTVSNSTSQIEHEAKVSKISEDQLWYLKSRGLSEGEATKLIVNGFIQSVTAELPDEYSIEIDRLLDLALLNE